MFQKRRDGVGIIFIGYHSQGQPLRSSIEMARTVTLRLADETVIIRDVVRTDSGQYRGVICGFEPSCALEYEGLKLEQQVTFDEENIFSCTDG